MSEVKPELSLRGTAEELRRDIQQQIITLRGLLAQDCEQPRRKLLKRLLRQAHCALVCSPETINSDANTSFQLAALFGSINLLWR